MTDRPSLRRVLGFSDVFNFLVGTVIGSGVFLVSAAMASAVGSPTLMLGVWVLGGALSLFGALALAELGAAYPESGGMYVYLREAYGPLVAFLFGWTSFLVIEAGGIATLVVGVRDSYLPFFVELSPALSELVAVTLIMSLGVINVLGVRGSALVQRVLTALKITAILAIVGGLLAFADGDTSHFVNPPAPPLVARAARRASASRWWRRSGPTKAGSWSR